MSFHESKFSVNQCHKTRVVGGGNISRLEWKVKLENDTGELKTPIQDPHGPFRQVMENKEENFHHLRGSLMPIAPLMTSSSCLPVSAWHE
jgi:hypothetical protein